MKEVRITEVTPEVYDIFDMTGFTNIIKISKEFRKFSVAECKMLGKGGCGEVYRIDDETIIKVYTDGSSQETIEGKMNRAKQAFICGVPTAISYNVVDCDGKLGEYISAEQITKIHKLIDSIPYKECLIHGDCHPNNVMFQGDEMVLIDMSEVACDQPIFEFGALYQDLVGVSEQNSKALVGVEMS